MRRILACTFAIGFIAAPAMAHQGHVALQQSAQPAKVSSTELGHGIYMLQGRGGNIGVLTGPDGVFVIDSQYADMSAANLAEIQSIAGTAPTYLVNTHWHGDHTGGNVAFNAAGAMIFAHENVRTRKSTLQTRKIGDRESVTPASPSAAWPIVTFPETMSLHLNGQTIRLIHLPGAHTDGDTAVYFEEANVLHMGDVMFAGMFPYIDLSSGGSLDGYIAALEVAYDLTDEDTVVIPGHGKISSRADIEALADVLREAKSEVSALVADGMSAEEVVEKRPLSVLAETWATAFMTEEIFTSIIYADIVANMPE